jgi:putative membrane protein
MQWQIVALNLFYAVAGVVLMLVTFKVFDLLTPKINFEDELKGGNIAVAICIGAIFVSIAIIIGGALN